MFLVSDTDQIISHFLNDICCITGRNACRIMCNEDSLLGLNTHDTLLFVLTIDGSFICLNTELLDTFNVETGHVQIRAVCETLNDSLYLCRLEGQVTGVSPDTSTVGTVNCGLVKALGCDNVISVSCIERKEVSVSNC